MTSQAVTRSAFSLDTVQRKNFVGMGARILGRSTTIFDDAIGMWVATDGAGIVSYHDDYADARFHAVIPEVDRYVRYQYWYTEESLLDDMVQSALIAIWQYCQAPTIAHKPVPLDTITSGLLIRRGMQYANACRLHDNRRHRPDDFSVDQMIVQHNGNDESDFATERGLLINNQQEILDLEIEIMWADFIENLDEQSRKVVLGLLNGEKQCDIADMLSVSPTVIYSCLKRIRNMPDLCEALGKVLSKKTASA